MCKIGYIDDDKAYFDDYTKKLSRVGIELLCIESCQTMEEVEHWILTNNVECMLIDYQQNPFKGTELTAYLNQELPDLPCFVLTAYCEQGVAENLVIENLIIDRDKSFGEDSGSEEFKKFANDLKQAASVFKNRLRMSFDEFERLKEKRENETISAIEDERFKKLFKVLRAYGEVDDIPLILLDNKISEKLSEILTSLNKLIEK